MACESLAFAACSFALPSCVTFGITSFGSRVTWTCTLPLRGFFAAPAVAVWFGWQSVFEEKIFAIWILDYLLAFAFGILFQYFTIVPMKKLPPGKGLVAALKADTLSLTAWQVGMYGFMAFAQFYVFRAVLGTRLETNTPEFWFMMQIAMIFGFLTSYPVNRLLIHKGLKEKM